MYESVAHHLLHSHNFSKLWHAHIIFQRFGILTHKHASRCMISFVYRKSNGTLRCYHDHSRRQSIWCCCAYHQDHPMFLQSDVVDANTNWCRQNTYNNKTQHPLPLPTHGSPLGAYAQLLWQASRLAWILLSIIWIIRCSSNPLQWMPKKTLEQQDPLSLSISVW